MQVASRSADLIGKAQAASPAMRARRFTPPWRNPWRHAWFLESFTAWVYLAWCAVPGRDRCALLVQQREVTVHLARLFHALVHERSRQLRITQP